MAHEKPSPVTARIVAAVAAKPGITALEIAAALKHNPESTRHLAVKAARLGQLSRQLAPATATGPRWLYYPAVVS